MARLGKSDAERNREESHAKTKINLELALKAIDEARDWERSWANNITNLEQDLEQMRNRLRIILRSVEPVDSDGHVRILPVMKTEDYDTAERNIIVIGDE